MLTKVIHLLVSSCLLAGILSACSSGEWQDEMHPASGMTVYLHPASTRSSIDPGTADENKIGDIRVWFFADNAAGSDQALYCSPLLTPVSPEGGLFSLHFSDELLRPYGMNSEGSYRVFVVANPGTASIDANTTLDALSRHSHTAATRPGTPFCMTGSTAAAHDFLTNSRVDIPLVRIASRLDITLINETGKTWQLKKVSLSDDQQSVQLFEPVGSTVPASDAFAAPLEILSAATTTDSLTCSAYIYENLSTTPTKVLIEAAVDGADKTYTAILQPANAPLLLRNSVYRIKLKVRETKSRLSIIRQA